MCIRDRYSKTTLVANKDGKCTVCGAADPNYKPGVKTGDESNTALWIVMMASAALLAAAVVVLPRRKRTR